MHLIGIQYDRLGLNVGSLPFAPEDATAGSESEMQTVVIGKGQSRSAARYRAIQLSGEYSQESQSRDASEKIMTDLENIRRRQWRYLGEQLGALSQKKLGKYAEEVLQHDLQG